METAAAYAVQKAELNGNDTAYVYTFIVGLHEVKRGMDGIGWVLVAESIRPVHEEEVRRSTPADSK
jgi:hypothetical protein